MQSSDPNRHAIIGWLTEQGHSSKAIKRIMERLDDYESRVVYRALSEDHKTHELDVHAVIGQVQEELVAEAKQEIARYLAEQGHSPEEAESILKRLEKYDVQVVGQMLTEAATDSILTQVLDEVRSDRVLGGFVAKCGDVAQARKWIKSVQNLVEYFGSFEALNRAVDSMGTKQEES